MSSKRRFGLPVKNVNLSSNITKNLMVVGLVSLLFTCIAISVIFWFLMSEHLVKDMKSYIEILKVDCNRMSSYSQIDEYSQSDYRITVIDSEGTVLYENTNNLRAENMDNHINRPECIDAQKNGFGMSSRYSRETDMFMYYCAVKLDSGAILRISKDMFSIMSMCGSIIPAVVLVGGVVIIICFLLARRMSHSITRPIVNMANNTKDIAYHELVPLSTTIEKQKEQIWQKNKELLAENEKIKTITANMEEGLIFLDVDGRVIMQNESAKKLIHTRVNEQFCPIDIPVLECGKLGVCIKCAKGGKNAFCELAFDEKNLQVTANPVFVNEVQTGVVCLIVDITHHKNAEKMKQEFTANVSHELKTPLTSISGYAEIIESGMASDDDIKYFSAKIHKEAKRLVTLIGDIIKLSKLDEQADESDRFVTVDICEILAECCDSLEINATNHGVSIGVCTDGECKINGDREMIYELVYNLCDNAIRYNKIGGRVELSAKKVDDKVVLAVRDTGIGVPPEHIDRIFERFYRVDKSRSKLTGGTGLGLAIVKHIAEQHDAKINIESLQQKGTKITVVFKAV